MACPTGDIVIKSTDPRINYNLLPGEVLMTCPYNESHAIRPIKFGKHVMHCHRLHCKEQAAKNQGSLFEMCRYDRTHHVRKEELAEHESTCIAQYDSDYWMWNDSDDKGATSEALTEGSLAKAMAAAGSSKETKSTLPAMDELSLKVFQEGEDWKPDETVKPFDAEKRIHELRMSGYNVLNYQAPIGLTKSEKREFYERDSETMQAIKHHNFVVKLRDENVKTGGQVQLTPKQRNVKNKYNRTDKSSTTTSRGYLSDDYLPPIREHEDKDMRRGKGK